MIFIGYNYDGYPISIVNARTEEIAVAYWHGADIIPHSIKTTKDFTPLVEHPTGVYPLLKTKEVLISGLRSDAKALIVTK